MYTLITGKCEVELKQLPDASVDSIVTDPPYELSNDGKASPNRVFVELMFPEQTHIQPETPGGCELPLLISEVSLLCRATANPTPAATMPKCAVAFDHDSAVRDEDVKDVHEPPVPVPYGHGSLDVEPNGAKYLGCFALKLTDSTKLMEILNSVGCGFDSGRLRIGFRVGPPRDQGFSIGSTPVPDGNHDVWTGNDSLPDPVSTNARTCVGSVSCLLSLARQDNETFSADAALFLLTLLRDAAATAIRTSSTTGRLATVLETRRICVVNRATNMALAFDLLLHPQKMHSSGFMGKQWDGAKVAYDLGIWKECLRVLKPGGHLLAFGGSRTYHRMACAIEDAGFEIRDQIMWVYGSGFPKSLDIAKAIDKIAGAERTEVVGIKPGHEAFVDRTDDHAAGGRSEGWERPWRDDPAAVARSHQVLASVTEDAKRWEGWGTALKPAHEPIVVARRPLIGTVSDNVLAYGTGGINIAACRIPGEPVPINRLEKWSGFGQEKQPEYEATVNTLGRWPANLIHDGSDEVLAAFPDAPGQQADIKYDAEEREQSHIYGAFKRGHEPTAQKTYADTGATNFSMKPGARRLDEGSAARFYYCAKSSREDRNEGLDDPGPQFTHGSTLRKVENAETRGNTHATVKPTDLMRYLCRLVTQPGGTVLDPFVGSGSTGKAAILEGFQFIGIEEEPEHCAIAEARLRFAVEERNRATAQQELFA